MPFRRIMSGPNRGKFRSPSGRVFTKSQVRNSTMRREGGSDGSSIAFVSILNAVSPEARLTDDTRESANRRRQDITPTEPMWPTSNIPAREAGRSLLAATGQRHDIETHQLHGPTMGREGRQEGEVMPQPKRQLPRPTPISTTGDYCCSVEGMTVRHGADSAHHPVSCLSLRGESL